MPAIKISVDEITSWRAHQVALRENRSLANAIGVLVQEAWDRRQDTAFAKAMPLIKEEAEPAADTLGVHMTGSRIRAVRLVADRGVNAWKAV